jgi:hypothetical protein
MGAEKDHVPQLSVDIAAAPKEPRLMIGAELRRCVTKKDLEDGRDGRSLWTPHVDGSWGACRRPIGEEIGKRKRLPSRSDEEIGKGRHGDRRSALPDHR